MEPRKDRGQIGSRPALTQPLPSSSAHLPLLALFIRGQMAGLARFAGFDMAFAAEAPERLGGGAAVQRGDAQSGSDPGGLISPPPAVAGQVLAITTTTAVTGGVPTDLAIAFLEALGGSDATIVGEVVDVPKDEKQNTLNTLVVDGEARYGVGEG